MSKFVNFINTNISSIVSNDFFINKKGTIENVEGFLGLQYENGLSFNFNNQLCVSNVFIERTDQIKQKYSSFLPQDLDFSLSQHDVRNKLGIPNKITSWLTVPFLGKMPDADIYYFGDYSMAIVYNKDLKSIRRITLMTPEATPGRNAVTLGSKNNE